MCGELHHRGPDNQGVFENKEACLGHRRLAIIDLNEEANQPFHSSCGRYTLVFNGEVYNYKTLKEKYGFQCRTNSDTEVLLTGLMEIGKDFISEINGFFSFFFWDHQGKKGLLVRDRMGIKPLYYCCQEKNFAFCSELKPFQHLGIAFEIDQNALASYFKFNYIPAPDTILKEVKKVQPGELIELDENGIKKSFFYELKEQKSTPAHFKELLEDAVRLRLQADVPVGCFLSGGVDSSVISFLAKRHKNNLKTFSIGFPQSKYFDESPFAEEVAQKIGSDHHTIHLSDDKILGQLDVILNAFDEPFADSSAIAAYFLSEETAKHLKVVLSGDGADELLGGYNKHEAYLRSLHKDFKNTMVRPLKFFPLGLKGSRGGKWTNKLRQAGKFSTLLGTHHANRYDFLAQFQSVTFVKGLLLSDKAEPFEVKMDGKGLKHFLKKDLGFVLPNDMLKKMDFASMQHSLELRTPFLDHRLIESALGLENQFLIDQGRRKKVLYDLFCKELPSNVWNRPKHGFEVPLQKIVEELKYKYSHFLNNDFIVSQGLFNPAAIKKLCSDYSGNNLYSLWAYFVFQKWYQNFFKT